MNLLFLGFLIVMMLLMWFMQRQQKKQQEARMEAMDKLEQGDKVVTIGGLHGLVDAVDSKNKTIDIDCEGVILTFEKTSIRTFTKAEVSLEDEPVKTSEALIEEVKAEIVEEN